MSAERRDIESVDFEKYGDFNPDAIASVFDSSARLIGFEILRDEESKEDVRRTSVYEFEALKPSTNT